MQRLTRKTIHKFKFKNDEPAAQGEAFIADRANLGKALNWYNENGDVAKLRAMVEAYTDTKFGSDARLRVEKLRDYQISITMCAIASMQMAGCPMPPDMIDFLDARISDQIIQSTTIPDAISLHENPVVADLEGLLDEFFLSNYKIPPHDFYTFLLGITAKARDVRDAIAFYEPLLKEIETEKTNLTQRQEKAYWLYVSTIISDCEKYLKTSRKVTALRKPRKKKFKSAEQLSSKVRFKESETEFQLTSVPPATIIGAASVWLFNAKTRRLTYLETPEKLSIKGTTVIGFDPDKSFTKTIRKPETLADLLNTTRVRMLKDIQALKTKATPANGRISADVLILRANK